MSFSIYVDREHNYEGTFIRITLDLGFTAQELMLTEEECVELMTELREFLDVHYEARKAREQ